MARTCADRFVEVERSSGVSGGIKKPKKIDLDSGFSSTVGLLRGLGGEHPKEKAMTVRGSAPDSVLEEYYDAAMAIGSFVFTGFDTLDTEVQRIEGIMTDTITELQGLEDDAADEVTAHLKDLDQIGLDGGKKKP